MKNNLFTNTRLAPLVLSSVLSFSCVGPVTDTRKDVPMSESSNTPDFTITSQKEYAGANKIHFELEIPQAYEETQLRAIIASLPNPDRRNLYVFFRIENMESDIAYASGKLFDDVCNVDVLLDYGMTETEEHPGCRIIGEWIVYGSSSYVIYEKDNAYYGVFAEKGKWGKNPEHLKKYTQKGVDTFESTNNNDSQEYMEVHSNMLYIKSRIDSGMAKWPSKN